MSTDNKTRLSDSDLQRIDAIAAAEIEARPDDNHRLETIQNAGNAAILIAAETIQAAAVWVVLVMFALLEGERIHAGALALGQTPLAGWVLAIAFVSGNIILPIYSLRNIRGERLIINWTLRGGIVAVLRWCVGEPQSQVVDAGHNPTLSAAKWLVTAATILLALAAVLGPSLENYPAMPYHVAVFEIIRNATITEFLDLAGGVFLSLGGVVMLQSISHEIGIRAAASRPETAGEIWQRTKDDYMAAKIADTQRRLETSFQPSRNGTERRETPAPKIETVPRNVRDAVNYLKRNPEASLADIGTALNVSKTTAHRLIKSAVDAGLVSKKGNKYHAI